MAGRCITWFGEDILGDLASCILSSLGSFLRGSQTRRIDSKRFTPPHWWTTQGRLMTLRVAAIKGYNQANDNTTIATMTTPIRFSWLHLRALLRAYFPFYKFTVVSISLRALEHWIPCELTTDLHSILRPTPFPFYDRSTTS